jgi:hypothetical protein
MADSDDDIVDCSEGRSAAEGLVAGDEAPMPPELGDGGDVLWGMDFEQMRKKLHPRRACTQADVECLFARGTWILRGCDGGSETRAGKAGDCSLQRGKLRWLEW